MPAKIRKFAPTALKLLLIVIIGAIFAAFWHFSTLSDRADDQQTIVIGPSRFVPASEAALRVVVQEVGSGRPVNNAIVRVSLLPQTGRQSMPLFEGTTGESGSLPLNFQVPPEAEGDYQLVVETESPTGSDRLQRPVTIARDFRLLLSSDKPLYQPGQTIHLRALALDRFDLTPARGATIDFLVKDAKGNKVFRQSVPASDFGVAAVDFTLADMVNQGDYQLSATIGDTISEKTVEVRPYVLPKFGVALATEQSFYTPGQRVEGSVQADYFFGKPVAEGQVQLLGVVYDVERVEIIDLVGQTDAQGHFAFSFDLPDYFAGSGLDSGQAQFSLEATVIDQTDHAEQTSTFLPVAGQPIVIEAVAESGTLRPGVENIVYILTAYPDGTPAQTELEINTGQNPAQSLTTGEYGLAEFRFEPDQSLTNLVIRARDERGFDAVRSFQFQAEGGSDQVLLRADRAAYVVGEVLNLTVLTTFEAGSVYLDIVKDGQTLSTHSRPVQAGQAAFAIDVGPDLYGSLELHAYKVLRDGTLVRDTRVIVVDEPRDLDIAISADRPTYLPGDTATIDLQTNARSDGAPVQTALGLAVVDESVFALQRQDPGFAKLYFMLEAELLEPFYQVKGLELPTAYGPDQAGSSAAVNASQREAQDTSAQAAWTDAPTQGLALQVNSRPEKMNSLRQSEQQGLSSLTSLIIVGLALIPLLLWLAVIMALRGSGLVKRSLAGLVKVSGTLLLIFAALFGIVSYLGSVLYQVERFFRRLDLEEFLPIVAGATFALALLGLAIYAWRRKDEAAKFIALLSAGWLALFGLLLLISVNGPTPDEASVIPLLFSFVLVPGAYLLFGQKLRTEARRGPGWFPTVMGGVTALIVVLVPFLLLQTLAFNGRMQLAGGVPEAEFMAVQEAMPVAAATAGLAMDGAKNLAAELLAEADNQAAPAGEAPRLRQFFPETLYWNPEVVTDKSGLAEVEIPIADSITTWRLTALASSQDGRLGFTTQGVRGRFQLSARSAAGAAGGRTGTLV
jgi:5-hydroxyisourate hydrolase-like protein (transthyretin family)